MNGFVPLFQALRLLLKTQEATRYESESPRVPFLYYITGVQKHKGARSQLFEPGSLVWKSLLEKMILEFHAPWFLGSLVSFLLHSTRLCELPKALID